MKPSPYLIFLVFASSSWAEVITDGSVGPALNLAGPNFQIGQDIGTLQGNNLFHSFNRFNLNNQESATFTGANSIQNVISRVTGGSISSIDGLIKSEIGQANFYFVNPAGIIFGDNAQIDVPAAFHASTAAELQFSDGSTFSAINPLANQLSMASPESFGFTSNQTGNITITADGLVFNPGTTVSFSSQSINIRQADISGLGIQLQLVANGAQDQDISIQSLPDHSLLGDINIRGSEIEISGAGTEQLQIRGGNASIKNSNLFVDNQGDIEHNEDNAIEVIVKNLQLDNSELTSEAFGAGETGNISISVDESLNVINGSNISASTFAVGNAGIVEISVGQVLVDGQNSGEITSISSSALQNSSGNAGIVSITSKGLVSVLNGGIITSGTQSKGDAGFIQITAKEVLVDRQQSDFNTVISSTALKNSTGSAGLVEINVEDQLTVKNGGIISSDTFDSGDAGNVTVNSQDKISVLNGGAISSDTKGSGEGGDVILTSQGLLSIQGNGIISSSTFSNADAGLVEINSGEILLDGQGLEKLSSISSIAKKNSTGNAGTVTLNSDNFVTVTNGATISSDTFDSGDAGDVTLTSKGLLSVLNGAQISSSTHAQGDAGTVVITAEEVKVDRQGSKSFTGIFSSALSSSQGNADFVSITSEGLVSVVNGGSIGTSTFAGGNAGEVSINAGEIIVDGQGSNNSTLIASSAEKNSSGNAGNVIINSGSKITVNSAGKISSDTFGEGEAGDVILSSKGLLSVIDKAQISSNTLAGGEAGFIEINAGEILVDGQGSPINIGAISNTGIASTALKDSTGNAGIVTINSDSLVSVINNGKISSDTIGSGHAGNVIVNSKGSILIENGGQISSDTSSMGDAGDVIITSQDKFSVLKDGIISSNTFAEGDAGLIEIKAAEVLIDGKDSNKLTIISSTAIKNSTGNAGTVSINSEGLFTVSNGAKINSDTFQVGDAGDVSLISKGLFSVLSGSAVSSSTHAEGDAGRVDITAGKVNVDGQGKADTGIFSIATASSTGNADIVNITSPGLLSVVNGGSIGSSTFSQGNAGEVTISAAEVLVDGQKSKNLTTISSAAAANSSGNAGNVIINSDSLISVKNGGRISSDTLENGNAGNVILTSKGLLSVMSRGQISSSTVGGGDAGLVEINAGEIRVDGQGAALRTGIASTAQQNSTGNAGLVTINSAGQVSVLNNGRISSDTQGTGHAGDVIVNSVGLLSVQTSGQISSDTSGRGDAGDVIINNQDRLSVLSGGKISSSTSADGEAGLVKIDAKEVFLDGQGSRLLTSISSTADKNSTGNAGTVSINSESFFTVTNGAKINSDTLGSGDAGDVSLNSKGLLSILNGAQISSSTLTEGTAGFVEIIAENIFIDRQESRKFTGVFSAALPGSTGNADLVQITSSGLLSVVNGGTIATGTSGQGDAGQVNITTNELLVDGGGTNNVTSISSSAFPDSLGDAGTVNINSTGKISVVNGGRINSDTFAEGTAGDIIINTTAEILVRNGGQISSDTLSIGDAGDISINSSAKLSVLSGGKISSSTIADGSAGVIDIIANDVLIAGGDSLITSSTENQDSGNVGSVSITATRKVTLDNQGAILITSATESDQPDLFDIDQITINAPEIQLSNGSQISAASRRNIDASNIVIDTQSLSVENQSRIITSANEGNGGAITITAQQQVFLKNSQITTSVLGDEGNGGNINITSPFLVMDTGFIQANTAAIAASGGDITLAVDNLIPSNNSLISGGNQPLDFTPGLSGFNVIQAAAPDGVSGVISISAPELNITSTLASLQEPNLDLEQVGQNPCSPAAKQNTLKKIGKGAMGSFRKGQQQQTLDFLLNSENNLQPVTHVSPEKDNNNLQQVNGASTNTTSFSLPASQNPFDCQKPELPTISGQKPSNPTPKS